MHIHQRQRAQLPAVVQLIGDEVHCPALVDRLGGRRWQPLRGRPMPPWSPFEQRQAVLLVEPIDTLVIDAPALAAQHGVNALVAIAHPRRGNLPDAAAQWRLIGRNGAVVIYTEREIIIASHAWRMLAPYRQRRSSSSSRLRAGFKAFA